MNSSTCITWHRIFVFRPVRVWRRTYIFRPVRVWIPFLLILLHAMGHGSMGCSRPGNPEVLIRTGMGDIVVEVFEDKAPVTAGNFMSNVKAGTYDGSWFYRVVRMDNQTKDRVKIEVIQGGLFDDSLITKFPVITHESTRKTGIPHTDGVVSMARNEPGSASTEFFICIGDQPSLDYGGQRNPDGQGFSAFGKVIRGMEVVRAIQALPDRGQYLIEKVPITGMTVLK